MFVGWNTLASGMGVSLLGGDQFVMGGADRTLYAVWTHTLSYDANGGIGSMSPQEHEFRATVHLPANAFTNPGKVFAGWATTPTGGVTYNDRQDIAMVSSDLTLYAVWTDASSLLIHYDFSNQDCSDSSGNGNDGVPHDITYVPNGNGGYSASLNGSSSYIELPYDLVRSQSEFTIMMRFKLAPGADGALFGYQNRPVGNLPTQFIPMITVRSDGLLFGDLWTGTDLSVQSTGIVNDGEWHTVYFSATTSTIKLYLDGVAIATNSGSVLGLSMSYNQIGVADSAGRAYQPNASGPSNYWYYLTGRVGEFFLYDSALQ
jgi:hypothetical protein